VTGRQVSFSWGFFSRGIRFLSESPFFFSFRVEKPLVYDVFATCGFAPREELPGGFQFLLVIPSFLLAILSSVSEISSLLDSGREMLLVLPVPFSGSRLYFS